MRAVLTRRVLHSPSAAQQCAHRRRLAAAAVVAPPLPAAAPPPRLHQAVPRRAASQSAAASNEIAELASELDSFTPERIRSFCIIAHVDHGKSTLADRLLEETGVIQIEEDAQGRALQAQIMDTLEIEQQRGITVKAMHASLVYTPVREQPSLAAVEEDVGDDEELQQLARELQALEAAELAAKGERELTYGSYLLNLIDTPGHVDFSHEVMRTLAACQSAVLLVDANQGVQAQTVAVHAAARAAGLLIIPVINKIDLPTADVPRVLLQLESAFGINIGSGKLQPGEARVGDVVCVSAKTGLNVQELMRVIVSRTPHPTGEQSGLLRAALVDSWFDVFRGVICLVQVVDGGPLTVGAKLRSIATGLTHAVTEVGLLHPQVGLQPAPGGLHCGQVGYVIANIRDPAQAVAGDTLCLAQDAAKVSPLKRAVEPRHMVFAGVYPTDGADYDVLADAIDKLRLSDTSLTVGACCTAVHCAALLCACLFDNRVAH
jgi:small GTP-binding protein